MPLQDYRWAAGHNVALASLTYIEDDLGPQNYKTSGGKLYPIAIRSQPVDPFPVRDNPMSGKQRGDGMINHTWDLVLCVNAVTYIENTYLTNATVVNAAMTIYTNRHDRGAFARYNCYLVLPSGGNLVYLRDNVARVRLEFTNLVAL